MSGERGWKRVCCAIERIVFTVIAPYFTRFELKTGQKCCVFCYENNLTVPLNVIIILFKFALSCMNDHITPMFFKVPSNVGSLMKTLGQYGHSYTPSKFEWYIIVLLAINVPRSRITVSTGAKNVHMSFYYTFQFASCTSNINVVHENA